MIQAFIGFKRSCVCSCETRPNCSTKTSTVDCVSTAIFVTTWETSLPTSSKSYNEISCTRSVSEVISSTCYCIIQGSATSIEFNFRRDTTCRSIRCLIPRLQVLMRSVVSRFHANVPPLIGVHHIKPYHDRLYLQHKRITISHLTHVNPALFTNYGPSKCCLTFMSKKGPVRLLRSTNQMYIEAMAGAKLGTLRHDKKTPRNLARNNNAVRSGCGLFQLPISVLRTRSDIYCTWSFDLDHVSTVPFNHSFF